MRYLLTTIMLLSFSWTQAEETNVNTSTLARSEYITGRGSANGFCQNNYSYFCVDGLKRNAENDASRDARWTCDSRGGRAFSSGYCSSSCSPSYIPPDGGSTFVSCRAECQLRCEFED